MTSPAVQARVASIRAETSRAVVSPSLRRTPGLRLDADRWRWSWPALLRTSSSASTAFPNIDLPTIRVQTIYPGAASAEVESEVTQPLEDAVATVAGLDELRSISQRRRVDADAHVPARPEHQRRRAGRARRDRGVLNRLPPGHRSAGRAEAGPRRLADHDARRLRPARHPRAVLAWPTAT